MYGTYSAYEVEKTCNLLIYINSTKFFNIAT